MKKYLCILTVLLFITIIYPGKLLAQGDLLITPVRVVFEDGNTKQDLNLSNIGQDTSVYMISFVHYRMQEDGSFKQIDNADTLSDRADKYLRIFPRRVTLPPGESQVIRLQYRRLPGIANGEYRSHLYFRAEKNITPLGMENPDIDSTQMVVSITPIFGISIPVIIRKGKLDLQTNLSGVEVEAVNDSVCHLNVTINRTGEKSAYGNLTVKYLPENGTPVQVGATNGVGIYPEIDKRNFSMTLRLTNGLRFANGKLLICYETTGNKGKRKLAETEYQMKK